MRKKKYKINNYHKTYYKKFNWTSNYLIFYNSIMILKIWKLNLKLIVMFKDTCSKNNYEYYRINYKIVKINNFKIISVMKYV